MAEDIDVARLKAVMVAVDTQFRADIAADKKEMQGLYASVETLPPALQKLQNRMDSTTAKIDEQRKKVNQMDEALDESVAAHAALEIAAGRVGDIDLYDYFSKQAEAIDKEDKKLQELTAQYKALQAQQMQYYQKVSADTAKRASAQEYADTSIGINTAATALRNLSSVTGGAVGNLSSMASQLVFVRRAMDAAKTSATAMSAAVSGGIMLAVSAVSMLITAAIEADEKQRQAYEDSVESLAKYESELQKASQAIQTYNNQEASIDQLTAAKKQLADLFPEMILGYTDEGEAILKNSAAMDKQIEKYRESTKAQRDYAVQLDKGEALDNYRKKLEEIEKWQSQIDMHQQELEKYDNGESFDSGVYQTAVWYIDKWKTNLANLRTEIMSIETEAEASIKQSIQSQIDGYDWLDNKAQTVAASIIEKSMERLLATKDEIEYTRVLGETIQQIRDTLADSQKFEDEYNLTVNTAFGTDSIVATSDQISNVTNLVSSIKSELKEGYEAAYNSAVDAIKTKYSEQYDARKASLELEYKAVEESLKTQQSAYQSLKTDVKSLDQQDLANKIDLHRRQLVNTQDLYKKEAMAVQTRYYGEAQLIVDTANKAVQVHKDKLAAIDEADRLAAESRTARQNANKIRDLDEAYAKQEAENERELNEKLAEYQKRREELLEVINKAPSRTALILAQQELDTLDKSWKSERQGLELEHTDKLLQIQRSLEEERLSQQETAEATARDKERTKLQEQISALEDNAKQQLEILSNKYTAEKELLASQISSTLDAERSTYQKRIKELESWKETKINTEIAAEKAKRDALVSEGALTDVALSQVLGKQYDQLQEQIEKYGIAGRSAGEAWAKGLLAAASSVASQRITTPSMNLGDLLQNTYNGTPLPGYASGGIITKPTLAWIGEGNEDEAILPMSKLYELVNGVLAGTEQFSARAHQAMVMHAGGSVSQRTVSNNYQIDHIEINSKLDADIIMAQLASMTGGL